MTVVPPTATANGEEAGYSTDGTPAGIHTPAAKQFVGTLDEAAVFATVLLGSTIAAQCPACHN